MNVDFHLAGKCFGYLKVNFYAQTFFFINTVIYEIPNNTMSHKLLIIGARGMERKTFFNTARSDPIRSKLVFKILYGLFLKGKNKSLNVHIYGNRLLIRRTKF